MFELSAAERSHQVLGDVRIQLAILAALVSGFLVPAFSDISPIWMALFLLLIPLTAIAVVSGDLRKFSFFLFVFLLPIAFQKVLFKPERDYARAIPVLVLSLSDLPLFIFLFLTFIQYLKTRTRMQPAASKAIIPFALWIFWGIVSMINSIQNTYGIAFSCVMLFSVIKILLLFIAINLMPLSRNEFKLIVILLVAGILIQGMVVMTQKFTGSHFGIIGVTPLDLKFHGSGSEIYRRVSGTLGHANLQAQYFALVIPLVLSLFLASNNLYGMFYYVGVLFTSIVGLLFTFSRGGWTATAVACVFCALVHARKAFSVNQLLKLIFLVSVTLLFVTVNFKPIYDRLFAGDEGATSSRFRTYHTAMRVFFDHPILGVGLNNYQEASLKYSDIEQASGFYKNGVFYTYNAPVHNRFLLTLSETGSVGLILFASFLIAVLRFGLKLLQTVHAYDSAVPIGLFSAYLGSLWFMQVEIYHDTVILTAFMLVVALLYNAQLVYDCKRKAGMR